MQTDTAIPAPAAVLAEWSMDVFPWLLARRLSAFEAAGAKLQEIPAGARGGDSEADMSEKANWVPHNYSHLME